MPHGPAREGMRCKLKVIEALPLAVSEKYNEADWSIWNRPPQFKRVIEIGEVIMTRTLLGLGNSEGDAWGYAYERLRGNEIMSTKQLIDAQTENEAMRRLLYWKFGSDPDCWNAIHGQFKDYTSGSQDFSNDVCALIDYASQLETGIARLRGIVKSFVMEMWS